MNRNVKLWTIGVVLAVLILGGTYVVTSSLDKVNCATPWLGKAVALHDLHLKDPTTTTEQSQLELMNQIMKAYECLTGKTMPEMKH